MDYVYYRQIFRKIQDTNIVEHHSIPQVNQHDAQTDLNLLQRSDLGLNFGQYGVLAIGEEVEDLSQMLIKKKKTWLRQKKELQTFQKEDALKSLRKLKKGETKNISVALRQYVEHIKKDPAPGLDCNRNWLYSGGTITTVHDEEDPSLVACAGPGLSAISMLPLGSGSETLEGSKFSMKINQPIHQVTVEPSSSYICARQKNYLTILKRDPNGFKILCKKRSSRNEFFTSTSFKNNSVAFSQTSGSVAIFSLQDKYPTYLRRLPRDSLLRSPVGDSWSQVHWRNDGLMIVRNKRLLLRSDETSGMDWDLTESLNDCEDICNYFESQTSSNSPYIATNHSLLKVDLRAKRVLHKWTHLMKTVPAFGQALKLDDKELVLLQSNHPSEAVAIGCGDEVAHVPPRVTATVPDALRHSQLQGVCLDPDVASRARFDVIGNHIFPVGDTIKQVTQNAGGDIFVRDISPSDSQPDDNAEARLESWREMEDLAPIPNNSHYSDIVDMTSAMEALKLPPGPRSELPQVFWPHGSKFRPEFLADYKDNLVEHVLEVWDVPQKVEHDLELDVMPSGTKVEQWLQYHAPEEVGELGAGYYDA